jgi:hypothetical protein
MSADGGNASTQINDAAAASTLRIDGRPPAFRDCSVFHGGGRGEKPSSPRPSATGRQRSDARYGV